MRIERNELLSVLSEALDSVETEVFGVTSHHAKRVAWMCIQMGKHRKLSETELSDLAVGALLHDNALNEYRNDYEDGVLRTGVSGKDHCIAGEENLKRIPGCETLCGFVLYHHECANGSGPFGKHETETPLGAQMIHIADEVDLRFSLGSCGSRFADDIRNYIKENEGILFGTEVSECFLETLKESWFTELADKHVDKLVLDIPVVWIELKEADLKLEQVKKKAGIYTLAELFAQIIDYKSPFTRNHSVGIAEKAVVMADYYKWNEEIAAKLYLAGALHDIGKLMVDKAVLEKPGRLDEKEYLHIQTHAYESFRLLSKIKGFEEVRDWASYHHEKLNGKGYPFGKAAEELNRQERLLACLDIYQALTEDRPYKSGMTHARAYSILAEMAEKGELDPAITADIDKVFKDNEKGEQLQVNTALFQCPVCGYIHEGEVIPQGYICPVCGQPETAFVRIL